MTTRKELRSALTLAGLMMASLALVACPGPTPGKDGGVDGGNLGECLDNSDCPDPQLFFCNMSNSKCEQSCRSKEQCTAQVRGKYALDFCNGSLGCECDEGKCVASLCSADVDCGATGACRNGACVAAPAASTVTKCQVTPDMVVMRKGAKTKFWVSMWDASNNPVVVKEGAMWAAVSGSPLMGSGSGGSAEFTANTVSAAGATAAVEATVGTVKCQAKALVLTDTVPADSIGVVVVDELSGRPLANTDVLLSKSDGAAIGAAVKTDAKGYAMLPLTGAPAQVNVTAFPVDHAYVTVANYPTSGSRYLKVVTRRSQADKYGGYKGKFKNVPSNANVHAAIGGMSLAGSITSLSLPQLAGPSVPTDIKIGSAINQMGVGIPAGVFLGFGDQVFKRDIAGQGLAGVCYDSAGVVDEVKTANGECGVRAAWALAGDVPLGDLPIDAFAGGAGNIKIGELLGRILPIFKKFNSSVVRDVPFTLKTTPKNAAGDHIFTEADGGLPEHFTSLDHDFAQLPLAFSFATKLPALPKFRGTYVDGAAIIGGANVPGRGVVPLGIGVGVNTDNNDSIDKQGVYTATGLVQVRMAPTHHGLEGSEYGLVIAAISAKALTDSSAGVGASSIYARVDGNKLVFDPTGTQKVDVSSLSFPVMPDGAKFNYTDTTVNGIPGRSFRLVNNPALDLAGLILRVSFTDDLDRRWDIIVDPSTVTTTTGFTLPKPPGTSADRIFANGMATGARAGLTVQGLRLNSNPAGTGGAPIPFAGFVEFGSTNGDRTTDFLTGFSFIDVNVPKVKFTTPKDNPATVMKGTKLALKISNFKIGTSGDADGVVKLSFTTGGNPVAGCTDAVLETETTAGNGVLEHTLPMSCVGANITLTGALLRTDKTTPIAPAVSASIVVTIQ